MEASSLAWLVAGALATTLSVGAIAVHVTEWRLYTAMRSERDALRLNLAAMTADRDGWRSVGERALLVAQIGARITTRAARIATTATTTNVLDDR